MQSSKQDHRSDSPATSWTPRLAETLATSRSRPPGTDLSPCWAPPTAMPSRDAPLSREHRASGVISACNEDGWRLRRRRNRDRSGGRRRPAILDDVDRRQQVRLTFRPEAGAGYTTSVAGMGADAHAAEVQDDLASGRVLTDVVVLGEPKHNLVIGDRVAHHHGLTPRPGSLPSRACRRTPGAIRAWRWQPRRRIGPRGPVQRPGRHRRCVTASPRPDRWVDDDSVTARPVSLLCPVVVGRDAELAALRTALIEAEYGRGGVMVLTGGAGMGKTRLLGEVLDAARGHGDVVGAGRSVQSASCNSLPAAGRGLAASHANQ